MKKFNKYQARSVDEELERIAVHYPIKFETVQKVYLASDKDLHITKIVCKLSSIGWKEQMMLNLSRELAMTSF